MEISPRRPAGLGPGAGGPQEAGSRPAGGRARSLIPFHSFSEIAGEAAQVAALRATASHLGEGGRLICTLHNPVHRVATEDGRLRLLAEAAMAGGERLLLWGAGAFDPEARTVNGKQIYEIYDQGGAMRSRMLLDVRFSLLERADCERVARAAGLVVEALYGDDSRGAFDGAKSPFMIFELVREHREPPSRH